MEAFGTPLSIFCPKTMKGVQNLQNSTFFTRIHICAHPDDIKTALNACADIDDTFCFAHYWDVVLFDKDETHHVPHVQAVLNMIKAKGWTADIEKSFFHKPSWAEAGFAIHQMHDGRETFFGIMLME